MLCKPRVNYDEIAHLYDAQPYRARAANAELLAFAAERDAADLAILDIGCGTGNQLIANRSALPQAWCVGLDRSLGMLRQARRKMPRFACVQADGAVLPFLAASFDFITSQFVLHHIDEKAGMLRAVFSLLRPGGRFILHNMCPEESQDWLCYEYFPEARVSDLQDFWSPDAIVESMNGAGFVEVEATYHHLRWEQEMPGWLDIVKRRDTCSQLQTISDAAYLAGVERLQRDVSDPRMPRSRQDHLCLVTILGKVAECAE
jgi:ubiquinone/menaquinone biosynthesis C-methylase UbiE